MNENAIPLLEQNLDKINWDYLSLNKNPNAIRIWKKCIEMDKYHRSLILHSCISRYTHIFTYNYTSIKERMYLYFEELIQRAWHPTRVQKWVDAEFDFEN